MCEYNDVFGLYYVLIHIWSIGAHFEGRNIESTSGRDLDIFMKVNVVPLDS